MDNPFNYEDFEMIERAKDEAIFSLFQDYTSFTFLGAEQILSFLDINSFFFVPFDKQDSFIAKTIQKLDDVQSNNPRSIHSLYFSLSYFFKEHCDIIFNFLCDQFIDIFVDKSAGNRLNDQFIKCPQFSISNCKTYTSIRSTLTLFLYQIPFLISSEHFVSSMIEQEFNNYSSNLQYYILQETQIIFSLSNHILPLRLSQEFNDTIFPLLIRRKCTEYNSHNLFPLVMHHPDSLPRVDEFQSFFKITHLIPSFECFQYESIDRVLHPGSNTTYILTYYLSAIKTIKTLGLPHYASDHISNVIFAYLKGRDDTFRCIISTFLTKKCSKQQADEADEKENQMLELGQSDSEQLPSFFKISTSLTPPSSEDIVGIFTNIYGSKELFISEYRTLLADRILSKFEFDLVTEFSNLSKLECKFGESYFTNCQVMLKDIAYSLDFQTFMQEKLSNPSFHLACYILSHNFWPTFIEETITIPIEDFESIFLFSKREFEILKSRRTLEWKTNIGLVELEVSLGSTLTRFSVSPIHAITLLYFKKKKAWVLKEMASIMKVPISRLRKKLNYWVLKGVLTEIQPDLYIPRSGVRDQRDNVMFNDPVEDMDRESSFKPNPVDSSWAYIKGILTANALSLDRLHSLLTLSLGWSSNDISFISLKTLEGILEDKVKSKELIFSTGLYSLSPHN